MANCTHTLHNNIVYFHNTNHKKVVRELNASKCDISIWYNKFRAFDTIVQGKTYTQALLTNVHSEVKNIQNDLQGQNYENVNKGLKIVKHSLDHSKVIRIEPVIQGVKKLKQKQSMVNCGNVARASTTKQ